MPTSKDTTLGETWWFGASRVEFEHGRVVGWAEGPFTNLRVQLQPKDLKAAAAALARGYFTVGSGHDEVLALQGTPTTIDLTLGETWWFRASRVVFNDGHVAEWNRSPVGDYLKVQLEPRDARVATLAKARGSYGANATQDEVLGVEGTPDGIDHTLGDTWWYGASRIEFSDGRINGYSSSPLRPLKLSASGTATTGPSATSRPSLSGPLITMATSCVKSGMKNQPADHELLIQRYCFCVTDYVMFHEHHGRALTQQQEAGMLRDLPSGEHLATCMQWAQQHQGTDPINGSPFFNGTGLSSERIVYGWKRLDAILRTSAPNQSAFDRMEVENCILDLAARKSVWPKVYTPSDDDVRGCQP